ncbi:cytochrome b/b6 domain-containing protein [Patulibacter sp.]|uniref:cytochrome b/b6 domain-containing protein n=1 Tax=Patulibacter sp. TaxID=1912859 RepID=UPI00271B99B5|nr:cytochrome b/b6 domain-containing protein [Patulibacter sp.]MDO9408225.1 cytochrome b/b6 domain-containing protein [Patulibacter sp.]
MASESAPARQILAAPRRVLRFGPTERAFHWIHAAGFTVMTGTGVVMYLPALSARISDRPTLKAIHLTAAVLWVAALVVVPLLGDRRALRAAVRQLETFDADDRRWLLGPGRHRRRGPGWRARIPQGRFNAAEKAHSIVQAALAVLFVVSGVLLWLGERDTAFRLPGTIPLHDGAMFVALVLVAGHVYLSLVHPPTKPAMRGMLTGEVDADWAEAHHPKWDAPPADAPPPGYDAARRSRPGAAPVVAALGVATTAVLVVVLVVL